MIDDAPPLVAIRGEASVLKLPLVAIVGSRNASAAGVKITERLTRGLVQRDLPSRLVSRAASMLPRIAPAFATGTVAVLAGGQDRDLSARTYRSS